MFIDTHCHIHDRSSYDFALRRNDHEDPADYTPEAILKRCQAKNVVKMICIGTSPADSRAAAEFAREHTNVFWSYGIHPDEAGATVDAGLANENLPKLVAIGEIGLDYHETDLNKSIQIRLLEEQLDLSRQLGVPCIFHVRDAFKDFWPILDNQHISRAVVHSFSDSVKNLEQALNRGFYIGVNGLATFANLACYQDLGILPLERTLLETDAPFLTPHPHRGKVNDPSWIPNIAAWLAEQKNLPLGEVAKVTTKNAETLFNI